jgi:predicted CoA-substrate-specific enzyme activase
MSRRTRRRIGIFSTLPVEVLLAAGHLPVDVNNLFVTHEDPGALLRTADDAGVPRTLCAWTRGLFGATIAANLAEVVVVPSGDCTNNVTMAQLLGRVGVRVHTFHFPLSPHGREEAMQEELGRFAASLGTDLPAVQRQWEELREVRHLLAEVDRAGAEGRLDPGRTRLLLLESTDFSGQPSLYARRLRRALDEADGRQPFPGLPVAVFGVPTILTDLPDVLAGVGLRVVAWETERDFAMVRPVESLAEQYLDYAYPYGVEARLERFLPLLEARRVEGVVINAQSFCHHNLELQRVGRALAGYPTLVVEADAPGPVEPRDRIRLEGFARLVRERGPAHPVVAHLPERVDPTHREGALALGLDLGSRFAKVMASGKGEEHSFSTDTVEFYRRFAQASDAGPVIRIPELLEALHLSPGEGPATIVSTGYGRNMVRFGNGRVLPELAAHARGSAAQVEAERFLLIDLGGQDTKAIVVALGKVESFVMNDKCAAGSGRYVENMARLLGVPLEEVMRHFEAPVELTNVCATFGESEVIGRVVEGVPTERICAGIMAGVASRTAQLVARLDGIDALPVFLSGGLAESPALAVLLSRALDGARVTPLPEPRFNGALGCLLEALDGGNGEAGTGMRQG